MNYLFLAINDEAIIKINFVEYVFLNLTDKSRLHF